jgi:hypothetical protein
MHPHASETIWSSGRLYPTTMLDSADVALPWWPDILSRMRLHGLAHSNERDRERDARQCERKYLDYRGDVASSDLSHIIYTHIQWTVYPNTETTLVSSPRRRDDNLMPCGLYRPRPSRHIQRYDDENIEGVCYYFCILNLRVCYYYAIVNTCPQKYTLCTLYVTLHKMKPRSTQDNTYIHTYIQYIQYCKRLNARF